PQREYGQLLREEELTGPASSTRVWVDDVNSDGKLDVLVGDNVTLISPAEGTSEEEFPEKFADWKKTFEAVLAEMRASTDDEERRAKAEERWGEVLGQRSEFMDEERTGFVWLYLRK
ncbi:MAG: hypothetical protein ACREJB_19445, partial [Planctomycetaceae bacterium]